MSKKIRVIEKFINNIVHPTNVSNKGTSPPFIFYGDGKGFDEKFAFIANEDIVHAYILYLTDQLAYAKEYLESIEQQQTRPDLL